MAEAEAPIVPITLVAVCLTCSETRYRSKFPISSPEQCKPDNFEPIGDATPLVGDAPPMCHKCGGLLSFTSEEKLRPKTEALPNAKAQAARQMREAPVTSRDTEVLFQVTSGETVKDIRDVPGGLLVITDRRIVRVSV